MPFDGTDTVLYEKKLDRIVVITINRPEKMNALTIETFELLAQCFDRFSRDEDAWVAILTGAGDRAFSVGAEALPTTRKRPTDQRELHRIFGMEIWKPLIAAINGYCIAGGWMLAQKCDIRLAAEHAELGISETRFNAPGSFVADLTRQVHLGHALEIALWGDARISAQRGYEIGWINRVVPKEKLMGEAMSWAERMLYLGPRSVRNIKETIYRGFYMTPPEGLSFATALEANLHDMEDSKEGARAFAEKRKPRFKNG